MEDSNSYTPEFLCCNDEGYNAYHMPRFNFILKILKENELALQSKILDIGPSLLTELIRKKFNAPVDTLGFGYDFSNEKMRHFAFDLNKAQNQEIWRKDLPTYDIVIMAEVIEHLYTAPELVLAFIKTLVAKKGILILQTPNAVSLTKRIKMLLGRNPYERIRTNTTNPGHFREYTISELKTISSEVGFTVEKWFNNYYFDLRYGIHGTQHALVQPVMGGIKNRLYNSFPKNLREGLTLILRRID